MPLRTSIQRKAESVAARTRTFADTLLARRGVAAAVIIALVAPLSFMLLGSGMVYANTLTRFATVFCGLTLFIAILVHGVGPIIKSICGMFSGNLITWNGTVLAVITLSQSAYFLATGYVHFADAFRPYFYEITASSDADTVSQHRILVLSEFVFLTSLTYYWAGMNRMVDVVKSLEESYRNPTEGTIGGLVAKLSKGHRKFDSALRLSTIVFLLIIQTNLNLSLLTSMDSSKLSTVKTVEQYAATATSIETAGGWFIFLSLSLLVWDWFIWWNAKKGGYTCRLLGRSTLSRWAYHCFFTFSGVVAKTGYSKCHSVATLPSPFLCCLLAGGSSSLSFSHHIRARSKLKKARRNMKLVDILLLSSMCLGIIAMSGCNGPPPGTITFGDGVLFWTAPTKVARHEKLYKDQGLDVTIATFQTGLAAKNALLAGSVDVAMVATAPIASSVTKGEEIRVIATYVVSDSLLKLVSIRTDDEIVLNDDGIRQDWSGDKSRVGYVPGTISQMMFDRLTKRVRIEPTQVKLQPGNIASALIDNEID